jgi:hypothetical protein
MSASRKTLLVAILGLGALCWAVLPSPSDDGPLAGPTAAAAPTPVAEYRVTGPFSHENLTVFLLHGPDTLQPRPLLTLDEALAKKVFVVHETSEVNTLMVENQSDDDVLIQPGDIVKGGKQDRLIAQAVLVPPKSGLIAVPSFCVEQGRWSARGQEASEKFAGNANVIAGKDLKNAALVSGQQPEVWKNVKEQQEKLAANVGKPVANAQSPTSYQLAVEDRAVIDGMAGYERALASVVRGSRSAVGYVIAVNGKVTGAEVYGSSAVLAKAWPKALKSAAVEALAEKNAAKEFNPATVETAVAFLADAEKGQAEAVAAQVEMPPALHAPLPVQQRGIQVEGRQQAAEVNREVQDLLEALPRTAQQPAQPQPAGQNPARVIGSRQLIAMQRGVQPNPVQVNRVSGKQAVLVEARNAARPAQVIHRSFVAK